jgi:MFS family permease
VLGPYREILSLPGAFAFSGAGFVARLPISMIGIGIVLLVSSTTGSYGVAGGVAAALSFAASLAAPQIARLVDRFGQARILVPAAAVHVAALLALMAAAVAGAPTWVLYVTAVVAGSAALSVGALVRARWTHLLSGTSRLHTAYSLESVIDELIFVVGPVLVTLLATQVHRLAGLIAVALFTVGGSLALAVQRQTEPPSRRHATDGAPHTSAIRTRALQLVIPIMAGFGAIFGAVEVSVVGFADAEGSRAGAGPVLAAYALGSLISGLLYGLVHWRASLARRFVIASGLMAASVLPMPFAPNLPVLALTVFLAGFAISPALIAGLGLVEARVPAAALTEGLTWSITGIGLGLTAGSALSGQVIDQYGASEAFFVAVGGGFFAAFVAFAAARTLAGPDASSA